jgi:two-component system, NarL family, response regulator DesR
MCKVHGRHGAIRRPMSCRGQLRAGHQSAETGHMADSGASAAPLRRADNGRVAPDRESTIRVVLAEDVAVLRETLVALLSLEADIEVVASLDRGDRVVSAVLEHHPDVALLDVGLPGLDGLTAAAVLAERLPACRVVILTGFGTPDNVERALAAGVFGFLLKDGPAADLVDAVRAVVRGARVVDPRLSLPAAGPDGDRG